MYLAPFFLHGLVHAFFFMLFVILFVHFRKLVHALVDGFFFFFDLLVHYFFPLLRILAPAFRARFSAIATACFFPFPACSSFFMIAPMAFFEALLIFMAL